MGSLGSGHVLPILAYLASLSSSANCFLLELGTWRQGKCLARSQDGPFPRLHTPDLDLSEPYQKNLTQLVQGPGCRKLSSPHSEAPGAGTGGLNRPTASVEHKCPIAFTVLCQARPYKVGSIG